MSSTTTIVETLGTVLAKSDPNRLADALRQVNLQNFFTPQKLTSTITANAAPTITQLIQGVTANAGVAPAGSPTSAMMIKTLRVTASGTAGSVGAYIVTDAGGTAIVPPGGASTAVGVALLSDDGTTITFPNTVTGVVIEFVPNSAALLSGAFGSGQSADYSS